MSREDRTSGETLTSNCLKVPKRISQPPIYQAYALHMDVRVSREGMDAWSDPQEDRKSGVITEALRPTWT